MAGAGDSGEESLRTANSEHAYRAPALHHPLDANGQLIDVDIRLGRRPSCFIAPVPASRKRTSAGQASLDLETYTENALINQIRGYLASWRALRNPTGA